MRRCKGPEGFVLISDAAPSAGLPDGSYPVWGETLTVSEGAVRNASGGLAGILGTLQGKGINVEYMYAFVQKSEGNAVLIFRFDEADKAIAVLKQAGVRVLSGEEMQKL